LGKELNISVLPKLSLTEIAELMLKAKAVVGVDTGLMHLAALLKVPSIGIYGATSITLTGARGLNHTNLNTGYNCSPCLEKICKGSNFMGCMKELRANEILNSLLSLNYDR